MRDRRGHGGSSEVKGKHGGGRTEQASAPGKRTLTQTLQCKATGAPPTAADPAMTFDAATRGAGDHVPYRGEMERAFGADFSGVSAHTGKGGAMVSLGAAAAASGERVAFAAREPSREVVAHELAHVVQHRHGGGASGGSSSPGDPSEVEADAVARAVVHGEPATVTQGASGIHRFKIDELSAEERTVWGNLEFRAYLLNDDSMFPADDRVGYTFDHWIADMTIERIREIIVDWGGGGSDADDGEGAESDGDGGGGSGSDDDHTNVSDEKDRKTGGGAPVVAAAAARPVAMPAAMQPAGKDGAASEDEGEGGAATGGGEKDVKTNDAGGAVAVAASESDSDEDDAAGAADRKVAADRTNAIPKQRVPIAVQDPKDLRAIELGTIRWDLHPDFANLDVTDAKGVDVPDAALKAAGWRIRRRKGIPNPHTEVIAQTGLKFDHEEQTRGTDLDYDDKELYEKTGIVRYEKWINLQPYMPYMDLLHEMDHARQQEATRAVFDDETADLDDLLGGDRKEALDRDWALLDADEHRYLPTEWKHKETNKSSEDEGGKGLDGKAVNMGLWAGADADADGKKEPVRAELMNDLENKLFEYQAYLREFIRLYDKKLPLAYLAYQASKVKEYRPSAEEKARISGFLKRVLDEVQSIVALEEKYDKRLKKYRETEGIHLEQVAVELTADPDRDPLDKNADKNADANADKEDDSDGDGGAGDS